MMNRIFGLFLLILLSNGALSQEGQTDQNILLTNEASINSEFLEYSPAFFEDGIIFISSRVADKRYKIKDKRINKNIMSIFFAKRSESGLLQTPKPFAEELLSTVHEGPMALDRTADNIFFTRNNLKKGRMKKAKDGIVKLKIYSAERVGDKWGNIKELPFNNDEYNTAHPSVSIEGEYLYFSSDRPGGLGGMDIWRSQRAGEDWGEPENLGPLVNSESDEVFPFIHADGSLYFASGGHSGFGGLDLYSAQESDQQWAEVENLGEPFNSTGDDFGFIIDRDKKNGYFSSNREGGLGEDDIFSFYVLNNLDALAGDNRQGTREILVSVLDDETGMPLSDTKISYILVDELTLAKALVDSDGNQIDPTTNELLLKLPFDENASSGVTDSEGNFPTDVSYDNFIFNIEKPGFQSRQVILTANSEVNEFLVTLTSDAFAANQSGTTGENGTGPGGVNEGENPNTQNGTNPPLVIGDDGNGLDLGTTIREGTVIELPNIYYNFNDSNIRPDARQDLDIILGLMNRYPDLRIELASHTDSRGSNRYNNNLSQSRAQNAVRYLTENGISSNRVTPRGYGESELRNGCADDVVCTEEEHQYNRRTEVRVVSLGQEIDLTFVNDTKAPDVVDYAPSSVTEPTSSDPVSTSPTTGQSSISGDGGSVLVIVGVFKNLQNAQRRLNQVIAIGFDRAEIRDRNGNNMVVAGQYSSRSAADSAASFLRENGVKTYIPR
ncbi:MAG: OmpA family protein [Saprospiraceae bacterium]|nr:OmpA family protein [Saprospiraceae bacterium]